MTLPNELNLPLPFDLSYQNEPDRYLKDLVFALQSSYEQTVQVVNGSFRNDAELDSSPWIPILKGTTIEGSFTYTNQYGYSLRQGLLNDIWFDVSWTGTTATGSLYLELPYIVTKSSGKPFVGPLQGSSISFGGGKTYLVCNAIPSTYRLEVWACGTGVSTSNVTVPASGQIIGSIRYIGQQDE